MTIDRKEVQEKDRKVLYAWEADDETIAAIATAEPSPEADMLNYLLD